MCMSLVFPSFLTFFLSFVPQTFTYLPRASYVLSTELGAEAVFLKCPSPQWSGTELSPITVQFAVSAGQLWSTEDTLFVTHLLYTRPQRPKDHHPPSRGLGSYSALWAGTCLCSLFLLLWNQMDG